MLVQDHRSTVGDLVIRDDLADLQDPGKPFVVVGRGTGSFTAHLSVRCPQGESTGRGFTVDVGSCAGNDIQTGLFGVVENALDIVGAVFKVKCIFRGGVEAPEEVDLEG